jgi:hypothetical protein
LGCAAHRIQSSADIRSKPPEVVRWAGFDRDFPLIMRRFLPFLFNLISLDRIMI